MLSCVSVSSLHHPTPASLFLHFLLDSRINGRSVFDSTSYKAALLKRRKEWFLLFFGCALSAVSATAIAFGENTVFVRMLLIPESLREQKGEKKRVQKQFWRRISFWPLIVINPVKIKIGLVPKHQYLWTKITFWSAEDEFCPCGVGQARHQVPVHMLGCAWVTRSKGKKCVIFESEAGTLEEKHDMTQLLPPFFLNTPKTGDCALIFFLFLARSQAQVASQGEKQPAGVLLETPAVPVMEAVWAGTVPPPPPQPPQPLGRLRTGKQKPEPDVLKFLVLGTDSILNKHERQHLNTCCCGVFFCVFFSSAHT